MFNTGKLLSTFVVATALGLNPAFAETKATQFSVVEKAKPGLGFKAKGGGELEDEYCRSDGGPLTVNVPWRCGTQFAADCKALGGTMSGEQPWGGQTCHTPS